MEEIGQPNPAHTEGATVPPLRLAIVSTPRSGNTWLRGLLTSALGLQEISIHRREELDWSAVSDRCVVQIHSMRDPEFVALLERNRFRVIVLARHPFDVLISALNYEQYIADPTIWTDANGNERSLRGASPLSEEFFEFASFNHRGSVLTISPDWWTRDDVFRVRYEDLVRDTEGTLTALFTALGAEAQRPMKDVIAEFAIENRRTNTGVWHYHFWHGRPGLWRTLLTGEMARRIYDVQRPAFEALGYACDPDEALSEREANSRWHEMQHVSLKKHLVAERAKYAKLQAELTATREHLERVHGILYHERQTFAATEEALRNALTQVAWLESQGYVPLNRSSGPRTDALRPVLTAVKTSVRSSARHLVRGLRHLGRGMTGGDGTSASGVPAATRGGRFRWSPHSHTSQPRSHAHADEASRAFAEVQD